MYQSNSILFQIKQFYVIPTTGKFNTQEINQWLKDNNDMIWSVKAITQTEDTLTILYEAHEK